MTEYRGKAALKIIASRLDSDPENPHLRSIRYVDKDGRNEIELPEKDFLWHLVRWAADYDMATEKGRVALFTGNSSIWTIELWDNENKSNPQHIYYLYF